MRAVSIGVASRQIEIQLRSDLPHCPNLRFAKHRFSNYSPCPPIVHFLQPRRAYPDRCGNPPHSKPQYERKRGRRCQRLQRSSHQKNRVTLFCMPPNSLDGISKKCRDRQSWIAPLRSWGLPLTSVTVLVPGDRKSTRLNSSHLGISYAVFCLKKKRQTTQM